MSRCKSCGCGDGSYKPNCTCKCHKFKISDSQKLLIRFTLVFGYLKF